MRSRARSFATDATDATDAASDDRAAVYLDPRELVPWPDNPRIHTPDELRDTADSIRRFGFGQPILARTANREIIAGHRRREAALLLNLERVPVRLLNLSESEAHLLALKDNRDVERTNWSGTLAKLLEGLDTADASLAGWSASEIEHLSGTLHDDDSPKDFVQFEIGQKQTVSCPKCGFRIPTDGGGGK